jgi:hypothetical protein
MTHAASVPPGLRRLPDVLAATGREKAMDSEGTLRDRPRSRADAHSAAAGERVVRAAALWRPGRLCRLLAVASLLVCPLALLLSGPPARAAEERGARAEYLGGTVAKIPKEVGGFIQTTDETWFRFRSRKGQFQVPYENINLLEYGQQVSRRYAMAVLVSPVLLLSKTKKHFLTVGYTDAEGRQQALIFEVDKKDVRMVLVTLEARTGRRVEFQDDEARKAGKG